MTQGSSKSSRRKFLAVGAAGAAVLSVPDLSAQTPVAANDETLALVNGSIHTMDARNTVAKTVTIRNGRFLAVDGPALAAGAGVRVIDLGGRTVVPGLVEPHIHS